MGKDGGDNPHLSYLQPGGRCGSRLDGAEHGAGDGVSAPVQYTGDGVAGHQQCLYLPFLHKPEHIPGHGGNGLLRVVAIGDVRTVTEVEDILPRQQLLHLFYYAEAPNAGVQNANGGGCM